MKPLPNLRQDVVVIEQVIRGERMYVYKVTETQDYYHLDPVQHAILSLLDGERDADAVLDAFHRRYPDRQLDAATLAEYIEGFRGTDLFEVTREERRRLLLETIRDRRKARAAHRSKYGNLFEITLPAWNPNDFFQRIVGRLWFFFTPGFVYVSLACIVAMLIVWGYRWQDVKDGTVALFTFQDRTGTDILQFYLIIFVIGFLHESAHGLTCRHFGGNVTQMGLLFLYFTPCFYVDVSDAYLLDSHTKRQWVIYAGGYFETFLCALATFVWALTQPGTLVNEISYKMLLMMGLSSVIINYNPLIKLDGYYSLMDYLEIPDLSERASAYIGGWIKKTLFRLPVQLEIVSRRVRRIFMTYGILSFVYKVALTVFFMFFMRNVFLRFFGAFGNLIFLGIVLLLFRGYFIRMFTVVKFIFLDKREVLMTRKSLAILGTAAGVVLVGVLVPPLPVSVKGRFDLEPRRTVMVRAAEAGWVDQIQVREGQAVAAGELIAVLRNEDLTRHLSSLKGQLNLVDQELTEALGSGLRAEATQKRRELQRLAEEVRDFRRRVADLELRAPLDGVVVTSRLPDLQGTYLDEGEGFCEISDPGDLVARVPVREFRLDEIEPGQGVTLKLVSYPFRTFPGRVEAVAPAPVERETTRRRPGSVEIADFDAIVRLLDAPDGVRAGMSGTARIRIGRDTIARRTVRSLHRWFESQVW